MLARTALVRTVARTSAKRKMSDAAPKMHKFKDEQAVLEATRPPKDPHEHVSFMVRITMNVLGIRKMTFNYRIPTTLPFA